MPVRMRATTIFMPRVIKALVFAVLLALASHANATITYPSKDAAYAGCMEYMEGRLALYQSNGDPYRADSVKCEWQGHGLFYGMMRLNLCPSIYCGGKWEVHEYHKYPVVWALPPPEKNSGPMTCKTRGSQVGNPINIMTGNKYQREVDVVGGEAGLEFVRHYNSLGINPDVGLGPGWTHTYARSVDNDVATYGGHVVQVNRPEGGFVTFRKKFDGTWMADDTASRLERQLDTSGEIVGWTYHHDLAAEVEHFDRTGRIVKIERRSSADSLILQYEADSLTRILDSRGRAIEVSYSPNGMISKIRDPAFAEYGYRYDAASNMLRYVDRPGNSTVEYRYGEAGYVSSAASSSLLTGVIDELGIRYASFTYDSTGRAIVTEHAGGVDRYEINVTAINTGWPWVKADVKSPLGLTTSFELEGNQSGYGKVTRRTRNCTNCGTPEVYTYDTNGNIDTIQGNDGVITNYEQDICGRNLQVTYAQGTVHQKTVQNIWKERGSILLQSDVLDSIGTLRSRSRWEYNERDQALAIKTVDPISGVARTTAIEYCEQSNVDTGSCPSLGLVTSIDGPRTDVNDITTFTYRPDDDLSGCANGTTCHRKGDLWLVTDATGRSTEYVYRDRAGRVTRLKAPTNVVTDFEYNARGWLTARKIRGTDNETEIDDAITRLEHDNVGQVTMVIQPDGAYVSFTYDAARRLTGVADNLGNSLSYTLDRAGNRIQEEARDAGNVLRHNLSRVFNHLGQLETLADAQNNPTDFTYDLAGNLDTVTDTLGRTTDKEHDALGRLRRSIANIGGTGAERSETQLEFDALDTLTAVIDAKGLTTKYTYNSLGDLVELRSPDTGTTSYAYDSAGNLTSQLDARGIESFYSYDALNRVTGIDLPTPGEDIRYNYDTAPTECPVGETFATGRLSQFTDGSGNTRYCYDNRGNVTRTIQSTTGGPVRRMAYTYNAADRVMAITYPSGLVLTYSRNASGQITGVTARNSSGAAPVALITQATYLPFGPLSGLTFGNGRVVQRSYDANYGIVAVADSASDGLALGYARDDIGNVVGLSERRTGGTTATRNVDYDGLDRLTALKDGTTLVQGFSYDATGNRTSKRTTTTSAYQYATDSHRLTKVGSQNRTYDAAGNTTSTQSTRHYVYDDRGRIRQSRNSTAVLRDYRYNALGQRVAKLHPTTATSSVFYVYDEAGRLLGEYRPNGALIKEYLWLDDTLVAVRGGYGSHKFQYVLTDHLNTPRAIVLPATNAVIWRWDLTQTAFGDHAAQNNPDGDAYNYVFNLRYPGQYFDSETGLHYNYFRDYDPSTGRYVQSDPIGLSGGINTYAYVESSPMAGVDFFGLQATRALRPIAPFPLTPEVRGSDTSGGDRGQSSGAHGVSPYRGRGSLMAASRPGWMTPIEQRAYTNYCANSPDPCESLKKAVQEELAQSGVKMNQMLSDVDKLYVNDFGGGWTNHGNNLRGRLNKIREMINLGNKMGCNMTAEYSAYIMLSVPGAPL